jgi:hypothetical protein
MNDLLALLLPHILRNGMRKQCRPLQGDGVADLRRRWVINDFVGSA